MNSYFHHQSIQKPHSDTWFPKFLVWIKHFSVLFLKTTLRSKIHFTVHPTNNLCVVDTYKADKLIYIELKRLLDVWKMDTIAKTTFLDIPDEILEKIFLQLSTHDVQQNLAKVCKRFLKVSRFSTMVSKISLTIENTADEEEMEKAKTGRCISFYLPSILYRRSWIIWNRR